MKKKLLSMVALLVLAALLPVNAWASLEARRNTPESAAAPYEKSPVFQWGGYYSSLMNAMIDSGNAPADWVMADNLEWTVPPPVAQPLHPCVGKASSRYGTFDIALYAIGSSEYKWKIQFTTNDSIASKADSEDLFTTELTCMLMTIRALSYIGYVQERGQEEISRLVWELANADENGIAIQLDDIVFMATAKANGGWTFKAAGPSGRLVMREYEETIPVLQWSDIYP